jgi:hypothetical protein
MVLPFRRNKRNYKQGETAVPPNIEFRDEPSDKTARTVPEVQHLGFQDGMTRRPRRHIGADESMATGRK